MALGNPDLKPKHQKFIVENVSSILSGGMFTINQLYQNDIFKHTEALLDISQNATGEQGIIT